MSKVTEEEIQEYVEILDKIDYQKLREEQNMRFFRRSEMMPARRKLVLIPFFIPLTVLVFTLFLLSKYSENRAIHSLTVGFGIFWASIAQYLTPQLLTFNETIKRVVKEDE